MPRLGNRVKDVTTTTGTGNITLSGTAPTGYVNFNANFGLNTRFGYVISSTGAEWECGIGYLSASTTLVREVVRDSSNSGAAVSFSAGSKDVYCDILDTHMERASRGRNIQTVVSNYCF